MHEQQAKQLSLKWGWLIICSLALVAILMLTGHKPHLYGALPYLLILACPLMHLFMHKNHGHNHDDNQTSEQQTAYACPMHPEIKQDKPGTCLKCGMDLILTNGR